VLPNSRSALDVRALRRRVRDAPTVFLLDDLALIHEIVVPPKAVDDILPFLRQVTGI
jgi:hypothetical protein